MDPFSDRVSDINELGGRASHLFTALVLLLTFGVLAVNTIEDVELLTDSTTLTLPSIGVSLSPVWLAYLLPVAVTVLWFYLQIYLDDLWRGLVPTFVNDYMY